MVMFCLFQRYNGMNSIKELRLIKMKQTQALNFTWFYFFSMPAALGNLAVSLCVD
jgi:hypothetical protein